MNIVDSLLSSSPIVEKANRHDDGHKLLPMRVWMLNFLATPELVGREKAAETRENVTTLSSIRDTQPENWKRLQEHYSAEKKAYNKTVAALAKGKQTSSIRQFRKSKTVIRVQRNAAAFNDTLDVYRVKHAKQK